MKTDYRFDLTQLIALCTITLLAPALRLIPSGAAAVAGRAAWLTAPAAIPLMLLYIFFIYRFMRERNEGEGLAELSMRCLGDKAGKAMLIVSAVWLLLYAGFVLRSGADRLITTIFPYSTPHVFIIVMGLLGMISALGSSRSIVRTAKLVQPVVLGVLLFILLFALMSVDKQNLLPLTGRDILPVMKSSLTVVDILTIVIYSACFLLGSVRKEKVSFARLSVWTGLMLLLVTLISAAVIGSFGAELTSRLTRPFFTLVRNLVFFGSLERIEALVVALWIFPDFLLVSALLFAAQHILRLVFNGDGEYRGQRRLDMSDRRWLIPLCAAAAIFCAILIAPTPTGLEFWSHTLIPIINLGYALIMLPAVFAVGKLRKKI